MRAYISYVAKEDFLPAFYKAYDAIITKLNIQVDFRAIGLVPYNLDVTALLTGSAVGREGCGFVFWR